jgi:hypothetical protein
MRAEVGDLLSKNGAYSQLFHRALNGRAAGAGKEEQVFADSKYR